MGSERGLAGNVRDFTAGDAQVGKLAGAQTRQLAIGLLVLAVGAELVDNGVQHFIIHSGCEALRSSVCCLLRFALDTPIIRGTRHAGLEGGLHVRNAVFAQQHSEPPGNVVHSFECGRNTTFDGGGVAYLPSFGLGEVKFEVINSKTTQCCGAAKTLSKTHRKFF